MTQDDLIPFSKMLATMLGVLSHGKHQPTPEHCSAWFTLLRSFELDAVRAAFDAHLRTPSTGRTLPIPADIIARLDAAAQDDGRPGAEEAWALALTGRDEADTVVWTEEVAAAWDVSRVVFPDEVGARMAFKEAYARLVNDARRSGRQVRWLVAEGHDRVRRVEAVRAALSRGIPVTGADHLLELPSPSASSTLLLNSEQRTDLSPVGAEALDRMRRLLAVLAETASAADIEARQRTAELKAQSAAKLARYTVGR